MELLGVVAFIPLLYYAFAAHDRGTLTAGKFRPVMFALSACMTPFENFSRIHVQVQRAFASSTRIVECWTLTRRSGPARRPIHDEFRDLNRISRCVF